MPDGREMLEEEAYKNLAADVPLALLPVRIETRFFPNRRAGDKPEVLRVRIFPDTIHADDHRHGLTDYEIDAGIGFWNTIWKLPDDDPAAIDARAHLAAQVGPYRAVHVAARCRPDGDADAGDEPKFPDLKPVETVEPVYARLLPDEWMLRFYRTDGTLAHTEFIAVDTTSDLVMAPALVAGHETDHGDDPRGTARGFLEDQDLAWAFDFAKAVAVGMACEIDLGTLPSPIGTLLVTGVRSVEEAKLVHVAEAQALFTQFAQHRFSRGLDVVPQGTPTNNSDAGRSGVSLSDPDPEAIFDAAARPGPGAARLVVEAMVKEPATMYVARANDALSLAFGHLVPNAFDFTVNAHQNDGLSSWAMNMATGFATIGGALAFGLRQLDGKGVLDEHALDLRDYYARWVRGGAALPTFRVGEQPYGVMPITSRPKEYFAPAEFRVKYEHYLTELLDNWRAALPVAALDPDATDARPGRTPLITAETVATVLGAVPHPTALQVREAENLNPADTAELDDLIGQIDTIVNDLGGPGQGAHIVAAGNMVRPLWDDRRPFLESVNYDVYTQLTSVDLWEQELDHVMDTYPYEAITDPLNEARDLTQGPLRDLVEQRHRATQALPSALTKLHGFGGVGSQDVLFLTVLGYGLEATAVDDLSATDDGSLSHLLAFFNAVERELGSIAAGDQPVWKRSSFASEDPLLPTLLDTAYRFTPANALPILALAFAVIRKLALTSREKLLTLDINPIDPLDIGVTLPGPGPVFEPVEVRVPVPLAEARMVDYLDNLLRESLGLVMYRLDAWVLALANERLATLRKAEPYGIQIGAYGWLVDIEPATPMGGHDDAPAAPSQGYIHAPSLTHATTAAVLRAGWSGHGASDGDAPLSVDLSSDQVRRGQWILDGLRNGQELGEVLGARFERALHDARLDVWIVEIRKLVLDVTNDDAGPGAVVDGLVLAGAAALGGGLTGAGGGAGYDMTTREAQLAGLFATRIATAPRRQRRQLRRVAEIADRISADLDAVADVIMFQSVHSLLSGDSPAAQSALAISSGADATIPPITGTRTARDGQLVGHRVGTTWTEQEIRAGDSIASIAEPAVAAWLAAHLPEVSAVRFSWTQVAPDLDGSATMRAPLTTVASLDDLGLSVVDAALLAGAGADQSASDLGRVVTALCAGTFHPEGELGIPQQVPVGQVSLDEFGLLASALFEVVSRARPLGRTDLVLPDEAETLGAELDYDDELGVRAAAVDGALSTLASAITAKRSQLLALAQATAIGIPGALTTLEAVVGIRPAAAAAQPPPLDDADLDDVDLDGGVDADADAADGSAEVPLTDDELIEQGLDVVVAAVVARLPLVDDPTPADTDAWLDALEARIGERLPVCPLFEVPEGTSMSVPIPVVPGGAPDPRVERRDQAPRWLRQVARVRSNLGALLDGLLLSQAVTGTAEAFDVLQKPSPAGPWVATGKPSATGDQLSFVGLGPKDLPFEPGAVVGGLLFDSWTESIPRPRQETGVAVHFDAPSARPPQTVLLSTVAEGDEFSADELADQLMFTLELAKLRAVGPVDLGLGQVLPGVFIEDGLVLSDEVEDTP
ncbi:MAG: hypothetical protein AAF467_22340 [Actinomycetota bacterium]